MANREFNDYGRPELFDENDEFIGSRADYDVFFCRTCGIGYEGLSAEDAAENHDLYTDDEHEFELQAGIDDQVRDLAGRVGKVVQVIEDGEVAVVRYNDDPESDDEIELADLERVG